MIAKKTGLQQYFFAQPLLKIMHDHPVYQRLEKLRDLQEKNMNKILGIKFKLNRLYGLTKPFRFAVYYVCQKKNKVIQN